MGQMTHDPRCLGMAGGVKKKTLFICHQKVPPQCSPGYFSSLENIFTQVPIWKNNELLGENI